MRILVVGATGGTGRELVEQALERGHNRWFYPNRILSNGTRNLLRAMEAHVMLDQVTGDQYVYAAPGVCWK